jgi:hypothetical protein
MVCAGAFRLLYLAVICGVAGFFFNHKASTVQAEEREELRHQIEVKDLGFQITKRGLREEQIETETQEELELARLRRETEAKAERARQKEVGLRERLIDIGTEKGLLPESVSSVNEHKYRTDIDLEKRWREIAQDLDAGDLLDLADQQLIKKQTVYLEEMYRRRYEIATGDDPPEVKEALLARYDKNIRHLEVKIDARQTGLLLSENGQEARRLTAGEAEGGTDYPDKVDSDDI